MKENLSFFEQILFEAPGDEPAADNTAAPDMPDIGGGNPPDMPSNGDVGAEMPPDMPEDMSSSDDDNNDFGSDIDDMNSDDDNGNGNEKKELEIDEKISNILNKLLYDKFLTLLNQIGSQLSNIKNNNEILHSIVPNLGEFVEEFKRLDESIRLYINNSFISENSSKNLLFFNQCLNALKMLNDKFSQEINKGTR